MGSEIRYAICGLIVFAVHPMWGATAFAAPRHTHQRCLFGQAQSSIAAQAQPESIATGDFNGDGRRDFAVVNPVNNTVSIILGNPDGTFAPRVDSATGSNPVMVVAGDFNGDGKPDLAIGREINAQGSGSVAIMLGNGDGTFQAAVDYPLANFQISGLTTGDFASGGGHSAGHADSVRLSGYRKAECGTQRRGNRSGTGGHARAEFAYHCGRAGGDDVKPDSAAAEFGR